MSRQRFLDLAASGAAFPIGTDLVLREHPDHAAIVVDGPRLGAVVAEAAARYRTPLALPLMDLTLEKQWLLERLHAGGGEPAKFQFTLPPTDEDLARLEAPGDANPRLAANLDAIRFIKRQTDLVPVGMSIGPFSLATKLLADPISPVFLAGSGVTAADEPEVALLERVAEISLRIVLQSVSLQLDVGASAVFIAEPAANLFYFSPNQLAEGSDVFERFVTAPNRRIMEMLDRRGADLIFHCCGELVEPMLRAFVSLEPAMLSLGSSRKLWEDARLVPKTRCPLRQRAEQELLLRRFDYRRAGPRAGGRAARADASGGASLHPRERVRRAARGRRRRRTHPRQGGGHRRWRSMRTPRVALVMDFCLHFTQMLLRERHQD